MKVGNWRGVLLQRGVVPLRGCWNRKESPSVKPSGQPQGLYGLSAFPASRACSSEAILFQHSHRWSGPHDSAPEAITKTRGSRGLIGFPLSGALPRVRSIESHRLTAEQRVTPWRKTGCNGQAENECWSSKLMSTASKACRLSARPLRGIAYFNLIDRVLNSVLGLTAWVWILAPLSTSCMTLVG